MIELAIGFVVGLAIGVSGCVYWAWSVMGDGE